MAGRRGLLLVRRAGDGVRDDFNRGDCVTLLGVAASGHPWLDGRTSGSNSSNGISSGQFYAPASAGGVSMLDAGTADVRIKATNAVNANANRLYGRLSDLVGGAGTNNIFLNASGTNYTLQRRVWGSATTLGTYAVAPVNGDVVELVLWGTQLSVYINGTLRIGPITEGWNMGATKHGLAVGTTSGRWDDFQVTRT